MKKSSKMKEYIKPAIICKKMECMQFVAESSIPVSDEEAYEEASAKEYHISSKSLWDD